MHPITTSQESGPFAHVAASTAIGAGRLLLLAALAAIPLSLTAVTDTTTILLGLFAAGLFGATIGMAQGCATIPDPSTPDVPAAVVPLAPPRAPTGLDQAA